MIKRIICDIVLFLGIFFLPWWGTVLLVFIFMILFKWFWEGIVVALFIDSLYSFPVVLASWQIYGRFGIFTLSTAILLFIIENIRPKIRI